MQVRIGRGFACYYCKVACKVQKSSEKVKKSSNVLVICV